MHNISLSVFFPCYNEEKNIEALVVEAKQVLDTLIQKHEILIINDGSTDNTGRIADTLSKTYENVRAVHLKKNSGYGSALTSGFTNCIYDWIFFTDGDNQFFIKEIDLLLKHTDKYDAIIGFRKNRKDSWHRTVFANTWNLLVQKFLKLKIKDLNCAFKLVEKKSMSGITLTSSGALISAELLFKLKLSGADIKEVGVSHRPRAFGKQTGGTPKVILKAVAELFKLYKEYKPVVTKK
jgi:glycosyltransferase involved in cell wall biosynthesis